MIFLSSDKRTPSLLLNCDHAQIQERLPGWNILSINCFNPKVTQNIWKEFYWAVELLNDPPKPCWEIMSMYLYKVRNNYAHTKKTHGCLFFYLFSYFSFFFHDCGIAGTIFVFEIVLFLPIIFIYCRCNIVLLATLSSSIFIKFVRMTQPFKNPSKVCERNFFRWLFPAFRCLRACIFTS